ncbi:MAG: hypothetical protein ABI720_07500 [Actinomycetes bacterium]
MARACLNVARLAALAILIPLLTVGTAFAEDEPTTDPLIVVGVPGLDWSDVSPTTTPHLAEFSASAGRGQLSVRTVSSVTCPADSWLTLSAGQRAQMIRPESTDPEEVPQCPTLRSPMSDEIPGWDLISAENAEGKYRAVIGSLGVALAPRAGTVTSIGAGAAAAVADISGTVPGKYVPRVSDVSTSLMADSSLTVIDLAGPGGQSLPMREVDASFGQIVNKLPPSASMLVLGVGAPDGSPGLQYLALRTSDTQSGLLTSTSTHEPGLVALTDIPPTITTMLALPTPDEFVGAPISVIASGSSSDQQQQGFLARSIRADTYASSVGVFFSILILINISLYGVATVALRTSPAVQPLRRSRLLRIASWSALIVGAVPVATFLANIFPWWNQSVPAVGLGAAVLVIAIGVAGSTLMLPTMVSRVGAIAALTSVVLAADVMTGGTLQRLSIMGYSPIVAGRFYGFGNIAFAVMASSALVALSWLASGLNENSRRLPLVSVAAVAAVLVVGLPAFGADFGGMLAFTAGVAVFLVVLSGRKLTVRKFAVILAGATFFVMIVSVADWLRPPQSRTHLGRFLQQVVDGQALEIVSRKLGANLGILFSNWLTVLVVAAVLFAALVLTRPGREGTQVLLALALQRFPQLRAGLYGWLVTMTLGFLVNDSGIAIPAVGIMTLGPLVIALTCTAPGANGRTRAVPEAHQGTQSQSR